MTNVNVDHEQPGARRRRRVDGGAPSPSGPFHNAPARPHVLPPAPAPQSSSPPHTHARTHHPEPIRMSARGLFLLAMAFVTFEAFAVFVLIEMQRYLPTWVPVASLDDMSEELHGICLWILIAAAPVTSVAVWIPSSIITTPATAPLPPSSPSTTSKRHPNHQDSGEAELAPSPHPSVDTVAPARDHQQDPYFRIYQAVGWLLYAGFLAGWGLCPHVPWSLCVLDFSTTLATLAFLAEILIVSSVLVLERQSSRARKFQRVHRKERLVIMLNNFNNMLLVVGAILLALSSELSRLSDDGDAGDDDDFDSAAMGQYTLSAGVSSLLLFITAAFNTYGLGGVLSTKDGWKFYQPFTGGAKFMFFQAISWTCFGVGIFLQGLYLLSIVIVEIELFVGAMAVAGLLFLISEVLMMASLLVFKGASDRSDPSTLPPFQKRLRDFAEDCCGAFLVGVLANLQWVPGALFFVLYGVTTRLSPIQVVIYALVTTFAEFLVVVSRSIATHLHNQDSHYGKRKDVSPYRLKFVLPQLVAMSIPGLTAYYQFVHRLEARYPIMALAGYFYIYIFSYRGNPQLTGCRVRKDWLTQRSRILERMVSYFNGKIICDAPLDPKQHYVMGFHPHGIMSTSALWLTFCEQWRSLYPGVHPHILTASVLHQIPLARDILQFYGGREVTRQAFAATLEDKESVMLVPGGQAEMLEQRSGLKEVRVYTRHKGFIRMAIEYGVPLVPVLSFKEGETMDNVKAPLVQRWFVKKLAFPFPYFPYGRLFLPIPRRTDIVIAVGAPIHVEQKSQPTPEDVDKVHAQYFGQIQELFSKYKDEAGCSDFKLTLL